MRVLITSGGTKVPIDPVRDITNKSNGTFGSKIATEFLEAGHHVDFLYAKHSKTPFTININVFEQEELESRRIPEKFYALFRNHHHQYTESCYTSFQDYETELQSLCQYIKYDAILLAAAVSDYLVDGYSNTKIKSSEDMQIKLSHAPKLISKVKTWCPTAKLIGFKMLVDVSDEELISAAKKSIESNGCSLVIANDYKKLASGNHEIIIVASYGGTKYSSMQAAMVRRHVEQL